LIDQREDLKVAAANVNIKTATHEPMLIGPILDASNSVGAKACRDVRFVEPSQER
jgi:hypothetical protein